MAATIEFIDHFKIVIIRTILQNQKVGISQ